MLMMVMACLSKLRRTFVPSLQRGWHHRADSWFVCKKRTRSRKQRILGAVFFGSRIRLKALLETRAVNDRHWIDEALIKAAKRGKSKCVKVLTAAGGNVSAWGMYRRHVHSPPLDRMTGASENITFPQLLLRTVTSKLDIHDIGDYLSLTMSFIISFMGVNCDLVGRK